MWKTKFFNNWKCSSHQLVDLAFDSTLLWWFTVGTRCSIVGKPQLYHKMYQTEFVLAWLEFDWLVLPLGDYHQNLRGERWLVHSFCVYKEEEPSREKSENRLCFFISVAKYLSDNLYLIFARISCVNRLQKKALYTKQAVKLSNQGSYKVSRKISI